MVDIKEHRVIIIPGLGDNEWVRQATAGWEQRYGLTPYIHLAPWTKPRTEHIQNTSWANPVSEPFDLKFDRLLYWVERFKKDSERISLVGLSAGGSMAVNALARLEGVHRAVCVCARLRQGNLRQFRRTSKASKAYAQSVQMMEKRVTGQRAKLLSDEQLSRILTLRAFYDEIVPNDTAILPGAKNERMWFFLHTPTQWRALNFPGRIVEFLKS